MARTMPDYETTDIDIASYLIAEGHSALIGFVDRGSKKAFLLSPKPDSGIISDFVNDLIQIKPARLLDTRRRLVTALQAQRTI